LELQFTYFNESGEETVAVYRDGEEQGFLSGFSRGVKWTFESKETSFYEKNKIINVCPLPTLPYIMLLFDERGLLSSETKCFLHYRNGNLHKQIERPGFVSIFNGIVSHRGNCWNLSLEATNDENARIVCTMEHPIRNGHASEFAKFYFDENTLSFGNPVEVWEDG
jgi:hypothetical protein